MVPPLRHLKWRAAEQWYNPSRAVVLSSNFTALQGQYLAFIRTYTLIHRQPPAETDMQRFFNVTAPSVHGMVVTLTKRGLIERVPGRARSIRVLVPPEDLPSLEEPSSQ